MQHRKIVLTVGFFIVLTFILVLISLIYVIEKKGVFEKQVEYKLIAKNSEDIEEGMPILFSGFEIGQVEELSLYDNGEVLIKISIPEHNTKWLRANAVFTLDKPLIGKPKITLISSMSNPPLNKEAILRMHIKDGINEIISDLQPLILELESIVSNINLISASLADKNASFQVSLNNLGTFSQKLADSPDLLHSFTGDARSAKEFHQAITRLNLALKETRSLVQNTDRGISEIRSDIIKPAHVNMRELELIFKDIRAKLKVIDGTVKMIGESDQDIAYFKDEMKVWLEEVTELSVRLNSIIGEDSSQNVKLP